MIKGSDLSGDIHTYHMYPLVICNDRYGGAYSGGHFTVWNCYPEQIPPAVFGSDNECSRFWTSEVDSISISYGVGDTVQDAVDNLHKRLQHHFVEVEKNIWESKPNEEFMREEGVDNEHS